MDFVSEATCRKILPVSLLHVPGRFTCDKMYTPCLVKCNTFMHFDFETMLPFWRQARARAYIKCLYCLAIKVQNRTVLLPLTRGICILPHLKRPGRNKDNYEYSSTCFVKNEIYLWTKPRLDPTLFLPLV